MSTCSRCVRVLLLADTHGLLHPRILALAHTADCVVHAGDIGHPDVLGLLGADGRTLIAVRGNNDTPGKWPASAQRDLALLDGLAEVRLPGGLLVVEHGDRLVPAPRRHALLRARHPGARLILYGHSHRQVIDDGMRPWVVNPGAAGRSRTYGGSACILLTAGIRRWHLEPHQFALADWKT